ncbi:hypothetical protein BWD42_12115 [Sphingobacterium sp. CZ-UAM]|uniref:helix-turn-helix domain-containing protein n=1 Tax=Sphingobacterium sp. CZ-UAM TaxID=1933868 RepID=UPI0009848919|nr:AraC family transcriptional regulator [Sphingobacterium sp. CZ-UAM]OOG18029.1 hypothetical protein BWD42_12115 [Sphingobacterium sp. CZ-UAM]
MKADFPVYTPKQIVDTPTKPVLFDEGYDLFGEDGVGVHKVDFFIIMLVIAGGGIHTIESIKYPIMAGNLHLVFPRQQHEVVLEQDARVYTLYVNNTLFNSFTDHFKFTFLLYQNYPVIKLSVRGYGNMLHEIHGIKNELILVELNPEILKLHLMIIGEIINREVFRYFRVEEKVRNHRLSEYVKLVDNYFAEHKQVAFYAKILNVTVNYLNVCCKKYLSCTATQVIQDRVIQEAKRKFSIGNMSIKEVGSSLGFDDVSYFTRFFREKTGLTPRKFIDLCFSPPLN